MTESKILTDVIEEGVKRKYTEMESITIFNEFQTRLYYKTKFVPEKFKYVMNSIQDNNLDYIVAEHAKRYFKMYEPNRIIRKHYNLKELKEIKT